MQNPSRETNNEIVGIIVDDIRGSSCRHVTVCVLCLIIWVTGGTLVPSFESLIGSLWIFHFILFLMNVVSCKGAIFERILFVVAFLRLKTE